MNDATRDALEHLAEAVSAPPEVPPFIFPSAEETMREMMLEAVERAHWGIARPFHSLAGHYMSMLSPGPGKDECLYHLKQARDAAIQA